MTRVLIICGRPNNIGGIQRICKAQEQVLPESTMVKSDSIAHLTRSLLKSGKANKEVTVLLHGFSDRIILRFQLAAAFARFFGVRPRVIWQPHYHPFCYHKYPLLARLFFLLVERRLLSSCRKCILISPAERDFFARFAPTSKLSVITNPMMMETPLQRLEEGDMPGVVPRGRFVLFVGRDRPNKQLARLIKLAPVFEKEKFKVVVVSDAAEALPAAWHVHVRLSDCQLRQLYRRAEAVLIPSNWEAFSLAAAEALFQGTPAIVSAGVMLRHILSEEFGLVVSDFSPDDMTRHLRKLASYKELANKSCDQLKEKLSMARYAEDLNAAIQSWS